MSTDTSRRANGRPVLIQGGMGVAVSGYALAGAVSRLGHLGVVSGTALDVVLVRRLQLGDPSGDLRRAIACFPDASVGERVLHSYFIPGGKAAGAPFKPIPMYVAASAAARQEIAMIAGFVEVHLAKEGHQGVVGINFLEKIQLPTPATLYGALLAGVDYVLVGAGIPRDIPALLDALCRHQAVSVPLHVTAAAEGERFEQQFDPAALIAPSPAPRSRPQFLAIVASSTLAQALARRPGVDGFVVEGPTAGGHNAPPRGPLTLDEGGEPVYGSRDVVDLAKMRALGLPFWLAGSCASPKRLQQAWNDGAAGVQVGSAFAFCDESGLDSTLRRRVLDQARTRSARVFTDPCASPTGFPFKVVQLEGSLSEASVYDARERHCDLGYLREMYRREDGTLGYRCPAEPVSDYLRKSGRAADTEGRKCICNGLMSNIGLGQQRDGNEEPPILTAGNDLQELARLLGDDRHTYSAADVVDYLLETTPLTTG
jgi:nitronate monooxygenase